MTVSEFTYREPKIPEEVTNSRVVTNVTENMIEEGQIDQKVTLEESVVICVTEEGMRGPKLTQKPSRSTQNDKKVDEKCQNGPKVDEKSQSGPKVDERYQNGPKVDEIGPKGGERCQNVQKIAQSTQKYAQKPKNSIENEGKCSQKSIQENMVVCVTRAEEEAAVGPISSRTRARGRVVDRK